MVVDHSVEWAREIFANTPAWNDIAETVTSVLEGQLHTNSREQALILTFSRLAYWFRSLVDLSDMHHVQVHATAARACFELSMDLERLARVSGSDEQFFAFGKMKMYEFGICAGNTIGQPTSEIQKLEKLRADVCKSMGWVKKNGDAAGRVDSWWGSGTKDRARFCGPGYLQMVDDHWLMLSQYVHSGAAGFLSDWVPRLAFVIAHRTAQESLFGALAVIAKEFRLADAYPEANRKLRLQTELKSAADKAYAHRFEEAQKGSDT